MNTIDGTPRTPDSFLSKRRVAWTRPGSPIGMLCCVCAADPGRCGHRGAEQRAAIARALKPGAEIVVAGVAFAGALGFIAVRFHGSRAGDRRRLRWRLRCSAEGGSAPDSQAGLVGAAKGTASARRLFSRSKRSPDARSCCTAGPDARAGSDRGLPRRLPAPRRCRELPRRIPLDLPRGARPRIAVVRARRARGRCYRFFQLRPHHRRRQDLTGKSEARTRVSSVLEEVLSPSRATSGRATVWSPPMSPR